MKKILFTLISMLAFFSTASAQSMKVYQNGKLKAIYYVSKDDKVEFSEDFPFPEEQGNKVDNGHNGHEYVDLGLPSGLKWATMNVGTTTPYDYGYYFAWGETEPKSTYDRDTYFDSNSSKYAINKKTTLDPEDDAAHVNWGGDWRMPTKAEQDELYTNCTWTWTTQNGIWGHKVSSKTNSNSIFLPAGGYRRSSGHYGAGSLGYFWLSSLDRNYSYEAYCLYFYSKEVVSYYNLSRYEGLSVRAVCP
ncbi:MAG: hypothetical protein KBT33_12900 [Prevotellaceae bacterium]|nr:hypothetical protein [Candidatus Minthosoma equi]